MKHFLLGLVIALVLGSIVNGVLGRLHCGSFCEKKETETRTDPKKANKSLLCNTAKSSCEEYARKGEGGNLKVKVMLPEKPVKRLAVNLFPGDHPKEGDIYVKYSDNNGESLFDDIPVGTYTIFINPKDYPKGYHLDEVNSVTEVVKGQTTTKMVQFTQGEATGQSEEEKLADCQRLAPTIKEIGSLKVQIIVEGSASKNLEVDLAQSPGSNRCMRKTDQEGVVIFDKVPVGKWVIFFNQANFPKYGNQVKDVQITSGQIIIKKLEFGPP